MAMRLKTVSVLVAAAIALSSPTASFAGAGDDQYIDPFATPNSKSLKTKCKKKKYKNTKKCKQYRKKHRS